MNVNIVYLICMCLISCSSGCYSNAKNTERNTQIMKSVNTMVDCKVYPSIKELYDRPSQIMLDGSLEMHVGYFENGVPSFTVNGKYIGTDPESVLKYLKTFKTTHIIFFSYYKPINGYEVLKYFNKANIIVNELWLATGVYPGQVNIMETVKCPF